MNEQAFAFRIWLGSVLWEARQGWHNQYTLRAELRRLDDTFDTDTARRVWIDSDGTLHTPRL